MTIGFDLSWLGVTTTMPWPSSQLTKLFLDQTIDDPSRAREELAALVDAVNSMIASRAAAGGVCDLASDGLMPQARMPAKQRVWAGLFYVNADLTVTAKGAWPVTRLAIGQYRVTHNMNLLDGDNIIVLVQAEGTTRVDRWVDPNSFDVWVKNSSGAYEDATAVRIQYMAILLGDPA